MLVLAPGSGRAQVPPPDEAWRTVRTEHFRVTFPDGMEALARRAGDVAETARARLSRALLEPPPATIELLLTDHVDVSNGSAVVSPYPRVTVFARPPIDGFALSNFDDWLELVITHELAHIVHLDVSGGLGRALRAVFGRVPSTWPFFPELSVPGWVVEGLATWYESALTGSGRVQGTYFAMALRTAALEEALEPLDRASGTSPQWPAGDRPYTYGSLFFEWLLDRFGEDRMADFVVAIGSQWVPYRVNSAAHSAFGVSFSEAWETWRAEVSARARETAAAVAEGPLATEPEPLTRGARWAVRPRMGPGGRLAFARSDGHSDAQLRVRTPGAGERGVRTNGLASFDWALDGSIVFSQLELRDPYRIRRDLYRMAPGGHVARLTRGERLEQPTLTPDGRFAWAVQALAGATRLVRVELDGGRVEPLLGLPAGLAWGFPAMSPDGRRVAAVWWSGTGAADLVVLDAADGSLVARVTDDRALDLAPAWAPDGTLLWTSDRSGIPNLYAVRLTEDGRAGRVRQVTDVVTGVGFASVDPDGRWIVLSVYQAQGWDVARIPYEPGSWTDPLPLRVRSRFDGGGLAVPPAGAGVGAAVADAPREPVREYSPWGTLRPHFWEPLLLSPVDAGSRRILGPFLGVTTEGEDLVGRHAYVAEAALSSTDALFEGRLSYRYRGLGNPVLGFSLARTWNASGPFLARRGEDDPADTVFIREREFSGSMDMILVRNRWRRASWLALSAGWVQEDRTLLDRDLGPSDFRLARPSARLGDLRLSLSTSTVRSHDLSVGPEDGLGVFLRLRARRDLNLSDTLAGRAGWDRSLDEALARVEVYRSVPGPGFADHVLAVRVAAGQAGGPGADAFHFDVGGAAGRPEPFTGLELLRHDRFFPVRGYAAGARTGRVAWSASAEWRFPLMLLNRGWRLFPFHVDRIHGAVFGDAGNAWGPELGIAGFERPRRDPIASVGAELRAEILGLFTVPATVRVGIGLPLVEESGIRFYLRFGPAF